MLERTSKPQLMPFQRAGVDALKANPRHILGDEQGLGKTPQLLVAASELGAGRVTIVCDAVGRTSWHRHLAEWAPHLDADVFSYDFAARNPDLIRRELASSDVLLLDEAHRLKSPAAKRTRAIYASSALPPVVWPASGTIAPNNASELWTHFKALFGETRAHAEWIRRYCNAYPTTYGLRITGNRKEHLDELRARLQRHMTRRRAVDVLKDLPAISWGELLLDPADAKDTQRRIAEATDDLRIQQFERMLARGVDEEQALLEAEPYMASVRRVTGELKAPLVAGQIIRDFEDGAIHKVIVFAHHKATLRALRGLLSDYSPVYIDGETPDKARAAAIDAFQSAPNVRVFIGQIDACSTSITLTAANHVVFAELSFNAGTNAQAAKRAHRIGQLQPVFVRVASLAGTIDEAVNRVLTRKARMVSEIFNEDILK